MCRRSPFVVRLSSGDRAILEERAGRGRCRTGRWFGLGSCCWPPMTCRTWTSRPGSGSVWTWCLGGGSGSVRKGSPGSRIVPGRVGRVGSGPRWWPGSRRWRASRPSSARCRCRGGAPPSSLPRPSARVSSAAISSSTVRRWLHADAIKPWRYRSWIFPRDPDFAAKAARVLDLYAARLGRCRARRRRLRDLRRREVPAAGAAPLPSRARPAGPGRTGAGRVRIRAGRHPGLHGRLRRAPGPADRPGRRQDRDRAVHGRWSTR